MEITQELGGVEEFNAAVRRVYKQTPRSGAETLTYAAIQFVRSARSNTKISRRLRDVELYPAYEALSTAQRRRWRGPKYRILVRSQKGPVRYILTREKSDHRREIRNRGLGKKSWGWLLRRVNRGGTGGNRFVFLKDSRKLPRDPAMLLVNKLGYIAKRHPRIVEQALRSAANTMNKVLDKNLERDFQRAWKA